MMPRASRTAVRTTSHGRLGVEGEWKVLHAIVHHKSPREPPSLREVIRMVAKLGDPVPGSCHPGRAEVFGQSIVAGGRRCDGLRAFHTAGHQEPPDA